MKKIFDGGQEWSMKGPNVTSVTRSKEGPLDIADLLLFFLTQVEVDVK